MVDLWHLYDRGDDFALEAPTDGVPVIEAVEAAEHEPNGPFWDGVIQFAFPRAHEIDEYNSEAGACFIEGPEDVLRELGEFLTPLLTDPALITDLIQRRGQRLSV